MPYSWFPQFLDTLSLLESSHGRNRLNPESGAAGRYGIMPANYERAGIDPNDDEAAAEWVLRNAEAGINQLAPILPGVDPVTLAIGHHFAGPDLKLWGPKTADYIRRGRENMGLPADTSIQSLLPRRSAPAQEATMQPASLLQPGAMPAMQPPMGGAPDSPLLGQRSVDRLLENPWFTLGASIMAADNSPIGAGLLAASQAAGKRRDPQYDMKLRQVQYLMQQGIPKEQAIAMVFTGGASLQPGGATRQPRYSTTPQYEQDAEGNYYAVQYADDGTRQEVQLDRNPMISGGGGAKDGDSPLTATQRGVAAQTRDEITGALSNIDQLVSVFDKGGWNEASFGTLGDWLRKGQSVASIVDTVTGSDFASAGIFPEDLSQVRSLVALSAMPVARAVIDSKGPLTDQERQAANRILGYGGEGENKELVGPKQAIADLRLLQEVLRRRKDVQEAYLGLSGAQEQADDDDADEYVYDPATKTLVPAGR